MTPETVLRRIEKYCRENQKVMENWTPKYNWMHRALGEARGAVETYQEIRELCREIRRKRKGGEA